jgi:hypothetical protein
MSQLTDEIEALCAQEPLPDYPSTILLYAADAVHRVQAAVRRAYDTYAALAPLASELARGAHELPCRPRQRRRCTRPWSTRTTRASWRGNSCAPRANSLARGASAGPAWWDGTPAHHTPTRRTHPWS